MQWWMWVIAVILIAVGLWIVYSGADDEEYLVVALGVVAIAAGVLGIIWFKHWEPQQHREHLRKLADLKRQQIATADLSDETFSRGGFAGNCIIPLGSHKLNGGYRYVIKKRIELPQGTSAIVDVPVDQEFLDAIGKLKLCK